MFGENKIVADYSPWPKLTNFTGRICYALDTEYDIQIFSPKDGYESILEQSS